MAFKEEECCGEGLRHVEDRVCPSSHADAEKSPVHITLNHKLAESHCFYFTEQAACPWW
jgi:hypothetical protein